MRYVLVAYDIHVSRVEFCEQQEQATTDHIDLDGGDNGNYPG